MFHYPEFSIEHTKEETLSFIDYLKHKDNLITKSLVLEPLQKPSQYFQTFDSAQNLEEMMRLLRDCPNALKVYEKFASTRARLNSNHKLIDGFSSIYLEDEIEYLMSLNFSINEAETYAKLVNRHAFIGISELKDQRFPYEYKVWACTTGASLYSRNIWFECFADEYISFLHRFSQTDETKYTITEIPASNDCSKYGHEFFRLNGREVRECTNILLGYHENSLISKEKMINIAETICEESSIDEIWLKEIDTKSVIIVRREK